MFFRGEHLVPVYTLANAAREIVAAIGDQIDAETVLRELAARRGITVKESVRPLVHTANFFKHADRDADATIEFDTYDVELTLLAACEDFGRVADGMPVEAQVFQAWIPKGSQRHRCASSAPFEARFGTFPAFAARQAERSQKIELAVLERAMRDPRLEMEFKRTVVLSRPGVARGCGASVHGRLAIELAAF
jgi:hypothetical protein